MLILDAAGLQIRPSGRPLCRKPSFGGRLPRETLPLSRICNPTAPSMSICNAANKVRKRKILSHCKCLYSKRSDCKSARASYVQNPPELAMPKIRPSCKSDRAVTLFMESKIFFCKHELSVIYHELTINSYSRIIRV